MRRRGGAARELSERETPAERAPVEDALRGTSSADVSTAAAVPPGPVLEARGIDVGYGELPVVRGLDIEVRPGEVVALLGANGAGKTTSLLAMAGVLKPMAGEIYMDGRKVTGDLSHCARRGLGLLTDDRAIFRGLTTTENLRLGRGSEDEARALFPALTRLGNRRAGLLSGGEQQMLALGRVLAGRPRVLLADELSLGLAPIVLRDLLSAVRAAADAGAGVLLVEQQIRLVLGFADRAYVLRRGRVVLSGNAEDLRTNVAEIERTYLGSDIEPRSAVHTHHETEEIT